jgi:hypothetical protein
VLVDLMQADAVAQTMALIADADALIEGHRPGVMERLGFGGAVSGAEQRQGRPWHFRVRCRNVTVVPSSRASMRFSN